MAKTVIKGGLIINRGNSAHQDLLIKDDRIERIAPNIDEPGAREIVADGKWVIPGIIDDQVHFREPGLTHKANIYSESRAALAGGVTSFMEMPNTKPPATTQQKLEEKYQVAAQSAITNYSFFMGASNENIEEVLKTDAASVCGIKVFMGSSTGNMLVDDQQVLDSIFSQVDMLIATHCEDEATIRANMEKYRDLRDLDATYHPIIRSREGCLISSSMAADLARKHGTRLHILHISTADELMLFEAGPVSDKKITSEACVHHMFFDDSFYPTLGNKIKCNPAIKTKADRDAIFQAVLDDRIDVIATDHAPHTKEEKGQHYLKAPSGLPLVQHSLLIMMDYVHKGKISKEKMVSKMSHAVADLFVIEDRGYLDVGKKADVVIVDPERKQTIESDQVRYKCGWSPLEGMTFKGEVTHTFVNGTLKYKDRAIVDGSVGERLSFYKR